ncbi:MAG TPA: ABC transporter permease [Spirochaetia bacterium]|nr:ABC transporter permease [Spirochaetia bacterium]
MSEVSPESSGTEAQRSGDDAPGLLRKISHFLLSGNTLIITVLAFFSAIVIGAIIIVLATPKATGAWAQFLSSPGNAFAQSWFAIANAYGSLLQGSLGSAAAISETLVSTTPLMMSGLGIALAFRAGLFNIGGQGQVILGAAGATLAGFLFAGLPPMLHIPLAILFGVAFGAAWGFIPGILKARTGAHEVITSMMLNYVGLNLLTFLLTSGLYQAPPRNQAISKTIAESARLPHLLGPSLRVNIGIILAIVFAIGVSWLLNKSTIGFRFRMLGANRDAARVAGVNIRRQYILALTLAGGLVGLAGAFQVMGVDYRMAPLYGGTVGFDGITVAILGRGSPLGVALSALLFGAFTAGGRTMQVNTNIPLQLVEVLQALVVLFVAAPGVIRTIYRIRLARAGERIFGGWGG